MAKDSPKRKKFGGRKKGTPNKLSGAKAAKQAEIANSGITPLEFMLRIMRDEGEALDVRRDMAKAAAPYIHPKLAAIEHKGDADNPIQHMVGFRWMSEAEARGRGWA
jgi:hypothetical protein